MTGIEFSFLYLPKEEIVNEIGLHEEDSQDTCTEENRMQSRFMENEAREKARIKK